MLLRNKVPAEKKQFAKRMRRNPTPPEAAMWQLVRKRRAGAIFHRQSIIRGFIADFYCPAARLVVETDGKMHNPQYDAWRDRIMNDLGFTVVRFPAQVVLDEPFWVTSALKKITSCLLTIRDGSATLVNS